MKQKKMKINSEEDNDPFQIKQQNFEVDQDE